MDIYAKKGDKVRFLNKNGYDYEPPDAITAGLVEGEIYTVEHVAVGGWMSCVLLEEFPKQSFNTVMFDDVYSEERAAEIEMQKNLFAARNRHKKLIYLERTEPEQIVFDKITIWKQMIAKEIEDQQAFELFKTNVTQVALLVAYQSAKLAGDIENHEIELAGFIKDAELMGVIL